MNDLNAVEKIVQWQKWKTLVFDIVSSPITKRVYNMAPDEFMAWFQQEPRPGFTCLPKRERFGRGGDRTCDGGGSFRCFGPSRNTNWTENTTTETQPGLNQTGR